MKRLHLTGEQIVALHHATSTQLRWWLPEGAEQPIQTVRGPLSRREGEALKEYYDARIRAIGDFDQRVMALASARTPCTERMSNATASSADAVIAAVEMAGARLGQAWVAEMDIDDERPLLKAEATKRIMVHDGISATPAEKIVESDEAYAAHRARHKLVVVEKFQAEAAFAAAKLRAQLAVRMATELTPADGTPVDRPLGAFV